jgi:hypothetical protein
VKTLLLSVATLMSASFSFAQADIPVSEPILGNAVRGQSSPRVASNGEHVLVVWSETANYFTRSRIVGARYSPEAEMMDPANLVFETGPEVLWTGSEYVVFDKARSQRISDQGIPLGHAEPYLSPFDTIYSYAALGDRILLAGSVGTTTAICLYDSRLNLLRPFLDVGKLDVRKVTRFGDGFAVFGVVRNGLNWDPTIIVFDRDGRKLRETSPGASLGWINATATGPDSVLVASNQRATVIGFDGNTRAIYDLPSDLVSVAWDGTAYYAVLYNRGLPEATRTAALTPSGVVYSPAPLILGRAGQVLTAGIKGHHLAFVGDAYDSPFIQGRAFDHPEEATASNARGFTLGIAPASQNRAVVATSGDTTLVVWLERRVRSGGLDLYARRFLSSGFPLDREPQRVASSVCESAWPAVAATDSQFLVAWTTGGEIRATRVDRAGNLQDSPPLAVESSTDGCQSELAAAGSRDRFVVTWTRTSQFSGGPLLARVVSENGTMTLPQTIVAANGFTYTSPNHIHAASDGQRFAIVFDTSSTPGRYTLVDREGVVRINQGTGVGLSQVSGVGWDGEHFVAIGTRWDSNVQATYAVVNRLSSDGASVDVTPGSVAPATKLRFTPSDRMTCDASGCAVVSHGVDSDRETIIVSRMIHEGGVTSFETVREEEIPWVQDALPLDGSGTRVLILRPRPELPWAGSWRLFFHHTFASSRRRSAGR